MLKKNSYILCLLFLIINIQCGLFEPDAKKGGISIQLITENQNIIIIICVAFITFVVGYLIGTSSGPTSLSLSGAAGAEPEEFCYTTPLSNPDPTGLVLGDPLNFRYGPGLDYTIKSTLEYCTPVTLLGRTSDSSWLLVKTNGGLEGWVYSYYIYANVDFDDLEVATGYGGEGGGATSTKREVSVVIQYGQAAAFVTGMPANKEIVAILAPDVGSAKGFQVASGWTDSNGAATLVFDMPTTWADGSTIKSGSMTLTVYVGTVTYTANLTYYTY